MSSSHDRDGDGTGLAGRLRRETGISVAQCYQCGKCSAGCPLASEMDYPPSQILRLLQMGFRELDEQALGAHSIWLCLTCETCHTRCPKEVDLPRVMDFLRHRALSEGRVHPAARDIVAFHKAFLSAVRSQGRLYEVGLIMNYKMRTGHLLQDLMAAPKLLVRGKLNPLPHPIEGKAGVREIFDRTADGEGARP